MALGLWACKDISPTTSSLSSNVSGKRAANADGDRLAWPAEAAGPKSPNSEPECGDDGDTCLIISGTVKVPGSGAGGIQTFGTAIVRVDFVAEPDVHDFDGSVFILPTHPTGLFASGEITGTKANYVITVGGVELSDTTGRTRYQTIANSDFYGVIIHTTSSATAEAARDEMLDAGLVGEDIEIVVLDTTP